MILASESWCKGIIAPSIRSQAAGEDVDEARPLVRVSDV